MSVLIKGMEMPSNCESCPCKTADAFGGLGCQATGYIPLRKANQDRPDWCPLVPVPPHGRLIDAAELQKDIHEHDYILSDKWNSTDSGMFTHGIDYAISVAPTIIPAEEGKG